MLSMATGESQPVDDYTRIKSYSVNTTITSRFARTHITIDFANERNCSTVRGITLQLPLNARAQELKMSTHISCQLNGVVKAEKEAQQDFEEAASQGQAAALLEAYDSTRYGIQVSLPPLGSAVIELRLEELLQRKRGQIDFHIPLHPSLPLDKLTLDVSIQEPQSGVSRIEFIKDSNDDPENLLDGIQTSSTGSSASEATAHFEITDFSGSSLPQLLRGFYDTGPLPEDGLLLPDASGTCFVHLFNPSSLLESTGPLPRNIVFVIDVSGSMAGQKLVDVKAAFAAIIQGLTDDDFFTIQTFSFNGIEDRFGPSQASDEAKQNGEAWVQTLSAGGGTNLEGAYVEGVKQVQSMQAGRDTSGVHVPVVVLLSDGEATEGVTEPSEIARNVEAVNSDAAVDAKIYGLAFGEGADYGLLSAISLLNGGRAVRIYEGFGDAATQMTDFYEGELGAIFMKDVHVSFGGTVTLDSQTQSRFPVFAEGSEAVVRARALNGMGGTSTGGSPMSLVATTVAQTMLGPNTWTAQATMPEPQEVLPSDSRSECMQSFAHAKISELMLFRDAAVKLGNAMDDYFPLYSMQNVMPSSESQSQRADDGDTRHRVRREQSVNVAQLAEEEALELALEASVVWPGLTAMVTVKSETCAAAAEGVAVCEENTDDSGAMFPSHNEESPEAESASYAASASSPASSPGPALSRPMAYDASWGDDDSALDTAYVSSSGETAMASGAPRIHDAAYTFVRVASLLTSMMAAFYGF